MICAFIPQHLLSHTPQGDSLAGYCRLGQECSNKNSSTSTALHLCLPQAATLELQRHQPWPVLWQGAPAAANQQQPAMLHLHCGNFGLGVEAQTHQGLMLPSSLTAPWNGNAPLPYLQVQLVKFSCYMVHGLELRPHRAVAGIKRAHRSPVCPPPPPRSMQVCVYSSSPAWTDVPIEGGARQHALGERNPLPRSWSHKSCIVPWHASSPPHVEASRLSPSKLQCACTPDAHRRQPHAMA